MYNVEIDWGAAGEVTCRKLNNRTKNTRRGEGQVGV